jgi:hypothetical protein
MGRYRIWTQERIREEIARLVVDGKMPTRTQIKKHSPSLLFAIHRHYRGGMVALANEYQLEHTRKPKDRKSPKPKVVKPKKQSKPKDVIAPVTTTTVVLSDYALSLIGQIKPSRPIPRKI